MSEQDAEKGAQRVVRVQGEWMGTCDHGETVWCIFRGTEHNAWRSLRAHATECPTMTRAKGFANCEEDG